MGLNLKNPEVESAIRKLASRTGESLTDAISGAVKEKLARLDEKTPPIKPARTVEEFLAVVRPYQERFAEARRRSGDTSSLQEMMDDLFDEHGLPK